MANTTGKKFGGRQKGTPNKQTKEVKQNIIEAFDKLGGVAGFVKWGRENPTEFYRIYSKLIPVDMQSSDGSMSGPTTITIIRPGEEDGNG